MAQTAFLGPHLVNHGLQGLRTVYDDSSDLLQGLELLFAVGFQAQDVFECAVNKVQFGTKLLEMYGGIFVILQLYIDAFKEGCRLSAKNDNVSNGRY